MSDSQETYTRQQMLDTLDQDWRRYIETLRAMPPAEQTRWAQSLGFASARDVLAHINAWFEENLLVITTVLRGERYKRDWEDVDQFNARAIEAAQETAIEQALAQAEKLRVATYETVAAMSDRDLENQFLYSWCHATIIEHIHEHALPST